MIKVMVAVHSHTRKVKLSILQVIGLHKSQFSCPVPNRLCRTPQRSLWQQSLAVHQVWTQTTVQTMQMLYCKKKKKKSMHSMEVCNFAHSHSMRQFKSVSFKLLHCVVLYLIFPATMIKKTINTSCN